MHHALEAAWERLYAVFEGARFERRADLIVALYPPFPIPQCNGPWVVEDSQEAVDALPGAIAEVEAAGARPWVQTRSGHKRTRQAAFELGLTHSEQMPGMVVRPGELAELAELPSDIEVGPIAEADIHETNEILATCFGAPKELFDTFCGGLARSENASWYVGRIDGRIVSTAVGFTVDNATGVFNVATPPEHRGRGYGAALTLRAVRDGFEGGSDLAYLQSSDSGHRVYRRLGFRDVEEYVLLTRPG